MQALAISHSVLVLRRGAFSKWRNGWLLRVSSSQKLERAAEHEARKLKGGVWRAWRKVGVVCWQLVTAMISFISPVRQQEEGKPRPQEKSK